MGLKAENILRLHAPGAGPLRVKVSRGLSQRLISAPDPNARAAGAGACRMPSCKHRPLTQAAARKGVVVLQRCHVTTSLPLYLWLRVKVSWCYSGVT